MESNVQVKTLRLDLKHHHKNATSASPRKLTSIATTQNLHKHKQIQHQNNMNDGYQTSSEFTKSHLQSLIDKKKKELEQKERILNASAGIGSTPLGIAKQH
jgi:hypothetical protein